MEQGSLTFQVAGLHKWPRVLKPLSPLGPLPSFQWTRPGVIRQNFPTPGLDLMSHWSRLPCREATLITA